MASPQFRSFPNPTLPYITFLSPTSGPDSYTAGQNTVISPTLELARRPGFATNQETAGPTHFLGTIQRIFGWRRWDSTSSGTTAGSFFVMLCETTATTSKVYKQEIGVDAIFQLVYTATATDGIPFDFIEANNFCFMGNGNVNDMRKYDGRNAPYSDGKYTSKWGISAPSSALVIDTSAAGNAERFGWVQLRFRLRQFFYWASVECFAYLSLHGDVLCKTASFHGNEAPPIRR
jgi:hypothetical protein